MSYIHEALKKAQKERDAGHEKFGGILSARGKETSFFAGRSGWWATLPLILILLAFTAYSWLYSMVEQAPSPLESEPTRHETGPQFERVADGRMFYERARHFHKNGQLKEARRLYHKTLSINPSHVDALNNLGVLYIHEKEYFAAQDSFEKAIRLKPGYVDPHYNIACLHAIQGDPDKSLVHLKKAFSIDHAVRDWALMDNDLKDLRGLPEFEEIIR